MEYLTIEDLISYFQSILDNGYVSGTDFELDDIEIEIYKMTISLLTLLSTRGGLYTYEL